MTSEVMKSALFIRFMEQFSSGDESRKQQRSEGAACPPADRSQGVGGVSTNKQATRVYTVSQLAISIYDSSTAVGADEKTGENFHIIEYNRKVALQERQERNHQCQHWSGSERAK